MSSKTSQQIKTRFWNNKLSFLPTPLSHKTSQVQRKASTYHEQLRSITSSKQLQKHLQAIAGSQWDWKNYKIGFRGEASSKNTIWRIFNIQKSIFTKWCEARKEKEILVSTKLTKVYGAIIIQTALSKATCKDV